MKIIKNILVPIDFSESTNNIVENAIVFADKFKATVQFIHVLPKKIGNEKVYSIALKSAEKELASLNEQINNQGIETKEPLIKFGNYADRIVFAANESNANLIIIGAGNKVKDDKYPLGTTAVEIIRESKMPVFVIKRDQDLSAIKKVLCPVDFSSESSNALNNAIAISRMFEADLKILSVYPLYMNSTFIRLDDKEENKLREKEQLKQLEKFVEQHNLVNTNFSLQVVGGDPAEHILKAIKEDKTDLLVMGSTGKSGITKILLGSVAEKVTREMACSFITSKKEDFLDLDLKAADLEEYYESAEKLYNSGFYQQAINMYSGALELNFSHIPSLNGLIKTYDKLGDEKSKQKYQGKIKDIMDQFESFRIEEEIRKNLNK